MKKKRLTHVYLLFALLDPIVCIGQSNVTISWDHSVGCVDNQDEIDTFGERIPLEAIADEACLKFCVNTNVTFTVNDPSGNVASINWMQSGGISNSSSQGADYTVLWNNTAIPGNMYVQVTLSNGTQIIKNVCIEVIDLPLASFTALSGLLNRCEGDFQMVNSSFDPAGGNLISHEWTFINSNGSVLSSSAREPNVFLSQGNWRVELTVTNECNCTAATSEEFVVEGISTVITCPTVICENARETYTIENPTNCNVFSWSVEGGTILSGGNEAIVEVIWDQPQNGFGYLTFSQQGCNSCRSTPVTVKIPVIAEEGNIVGETDLCIDDKYLFSLPQWPATVFSWDLRDASGNQLQTVADFILTDQPNGIVLNTAGLEPGEYTLSSNYHNPLLLCGGNAELFINVKDKHVIDAIDKVCVDDFIDFNTVTPNNSTTWNIYYNGNLIDQLGGSQIVNYTFGRAGFYTVNASSPSHCVSEDFLVTVVDLPTAINQSVNISGTIQQVCSNTPYSYSIDLGNADYYAEWRVDPVYGTIQGNREGDTVSVTFNNPSGPVYLIEVRQVSVLGGCSGPWTSFEITPLNIITTIVHFDPSDPNVTTQPFFLCTSSTENFRVNYTEGETYEWFLDDPRFGSVIAGQNTNEVTISLNELPANLVQGTTAKVKLRIRKCGQLYNAVEYPFKLTYLPPMIVTPLVDVCSGDTIDFVIDFPNLPAGVNLSAWTFELQFLTNTNIVGGFNGTVVTQPNATVTVTPQNTLLFTGVEIPYVDTAVLYTFLVTVTNMGTCPTRYSLFYNPTNFIQPAPEVNIISSSLTSFCDVASISTTLTAIYQNPNLGTATYQWYRNGSPINGSTASTLNITPVLGTGSYHCEVSFAGNNPSSCSTSTRNMSITLRNCSADPLCTNEQIAITAVTWTGCDEVVVAVDNFGSTPISVTYAVDGVNWFPSSSTITGATLLAEDGLEPGTYTMNVRAVYPNCSTTDTLNFTIGYQAEIDVVVGCGSGTHDVTIRGIGTILANYPNATTITYELVGFGNATSSVLGNHTFSNVPDGTYTARLWIDGVGPDPVCIATFEDNVVIDTPNASFVILDALNPGAGVTSIPRSCTECPLLLQPLNPNPNHTYKWVFLGTASNTQISPEISLPVSVSQLITLTVTDENGCFTSTTQSIEIDKADFSGIYAGSGQYCEGAPISLTFSSASQQTIATPNSSNTNQSGYLWMLETEPAPGSNTNATYNPTVSGQYWVKLRNTDFCYKDMDAVNVTISPKPYFDMRLPETVCAGQPFVVEGLSTATGSGIVDYRWIIDGVVGNWDNVFPIIPLDESYTAAGIYIYQLEINVSNNCSYLVEREVAVISLPILGDIIVLPDVCNPYAVQLTVSNPLPGTYHWSDGFTGYPHTVSRGGAYRLRFIPDNAACAIELFKDVDKDPSAYLWFFPSGCIDICAMEDFAQRSIPGFKKPFNSWEYESNYNLTSGIGPVDGMDVTDLLGTNDMLTLELENQNCAVVSKPLVFTVNENCADCEVEFLIDHIEVFDEPYIYFELYGVIVNNSPFDLNIQLSTFGNNGFFTPSSVTVPAGGVVSLNPIRFTPQSPFNGGNTVVNLEASYREGNCFTKQVVEFPEILVENSFAEEATLKISPNPVAQNARFEYELYLKDMQGVQLEIYSLSGYSLYRETLETPSGILESDLSFLKPSQYVVVITNNDGVIVQSNLIKQ